MIRIKVKQNKSKLNTTNNSFVKRKKVLDSLQTLAYTNQCKKSKQRLTVNFFNKEKNSQQDPDSRI